MSDHDYRPAAGLPDSVYTPPPPNIGLPVDTVPGNWGDDDYPDRPQDVPAAAQPTPPLRASPVPLIGAIPYGGIVQSAGAFQVGGPAAALVVPRAVLLGSPGEPRPQVTGILLWSAEVTAGLFEMVADAQKDQVAAGFVLPIGGAVLPPPLWLPVRRLLIRGTAALAAATGTFYAALIGFPTHDDA